MTSTVQFHIRNSLIGQLRSNDDVIRSIYVFSITFDWNKMETRDSQSVRLSKTNPMVCNMTYFSQFVTLTLTLGDLRSKLPSDLSGSQKYESIRLARETR